MIAHPNSIRWAAELLCEMERAAGAPPVLRGATIVAADGSAAIEFLGRRRGNVVVSARGDDAHFVARGISGLRLGRRHNWRRLPINSDSANARAKDMIRAARR